MKNPIPNCQNCGKKLSDRRSKTCRKCITNFARLKLEASKIKLDKTPQSDKQWRPVKGFEGFYEVSSCGLVRSVFRTFTNSKGVTKTYQSKILSPSIAKNGYLGLNLRRSGFGGPKMVHRLVAIAWVENPFNKPEVNHKDGNKLNNNASNLEWVTASENQQHAIYALKVRERESYLKSRKKA